MLTLRQRADRSSKTLPKHVHLGAPIATVVDHAMPCKSVLA